MSPEIALLQPFLNNCGPLCQNLVVLLKSWGYSLQNTRKILTKMGLPADASNGGVDYWAAKFTLEMLFEEYPDEDKSLQLVKEFLQEYQFSFLSYYQILSDYCKENPTENYSLRVCGSNTILILKNKEEVVEVLIFSKLQS